MLSHSPLRVKLVAALLGLVALALVGMGVATVTAVRGYLVSRLDAQIQGIGVNVAKQVAAGSTRIVVDVPKPPEGSVNLPNPFVLQSRDRDGAIVNELAAVQGAGPRLDLKDLGKPDLFTASGADGNRWRILVVPGGNGQHFVIAGSMVDVDSAVSQVIWLDVRVGLAVLIVLAVVSVAVVRRSLAPLVEIERTAAAIAGGELSRRIPESDHRTEIGRLGGALNTMLTQIETAFEARAASERRAKGSEERMRRFVADASHELRTPLTTIRGFAELYRQGAGAPEDVLKRIESEAARMGLLVEDLLLLARLDQQRPLAMETVELPVLVADAVQAARVLAPDREITLEITAPEIVVTGDDHRLRQVIGNLVGNALTHTPAGTPVLVRAGAAEGWAVIEIVDRGPGLTPEQGERVFERFYRADPARSRRGGSPGTGLGLAIVAALVAAHGGTVEAESKEGEGATFRVKIPLQIPS